MTPTLLRFILRRMLAATLLVFTVAASSFLLSRCAPYEPPLGLPQPVADAERAKRGLDRPILEHFAGWVGSLLRLDLGESVVYNRPVAGLVLGSGARSGQLGLLALVVACAIGLTVGTVTGASPRGPTASIVAPISVALVSCPPIVWALCLLLVAASTGWLSIREGSLGVPVLALSLPLAAMFERLQSQSTRDALRAPDLIAASARGVPRWRLLWIHGARQALTPLFGVFGVVVGSLFSGSLAVEWATGWPGLGRLMYTALLAHDISLIAGCALAGAVLIAIGNFVADVARAIADPRTRSAM
ncbi:MAG TPA: ABC transporter permease [Vicinamibacterales bacterium]|nr:ABC transporter permease [Vicinamibacterales bacterium]